MPSGLCIEIVIGGLPVMCEFGPHRSMQVSALIDSLLFQKEKLLSMNYLQRIVSTGLEIGEVELIKLGEQISYK